MRSDRPDLKLLYQIEELSLGGAAAKKDQMMANLTSMISFISPVAMLTMAAIGTVALGPISLTVMGLFAMLSSKNAWQKNKLALYKAFFDPHHMLVMEFDAALKRMISNSPRLRVAYNHEMRKMFSELKSVPEQATVKDARAIYRKIYTKHISIFVKSLNKTKLNMPALILERFVKLQQQLKKVHLLKV